MENARFEPKMNANNDHYKHSDFLNYSFAQNINDFLICRPVALLETMQKYNYMEISTVLMSIFIMSSYYCT